MNTKFYILAYDISDDKKRQKSARICESVMQRVQYSVFEGHLPEKDLQRLLNKLDKYLDTQDSLRIYELCSDCRGKIILKGSAKITGHPELVII